jgi:putative two-component system response regulator
VQAEFVAIAQRFADSDADMQQKIEYMANAIAEVASI